jgi:hypothetical protein
VRREDKPAVAPLEAEAAVCAKHAPELFRPAEQPARRERLEPVGVREAAGREARVRELQQRCQRGAGLTLPGSAYRSQYRRDSGTLVAGGTVASSPST